MWSAVHFPYETWDVSSRSRATTATDKKGWYTCKLSCCFVNLNLYVVHGLFCRHCICLRSLMFEGPPTPSVLRVVQRLVLSLTERRSILFSGTYLSGRKTPVGPEAGHYKNPILPFGLCLEAFFFSSDNVFWNSCMFKCLNHISYNS